jgi:ADP-ribose pyrophosphatase YjhB (NUDIX family)
VYPEEIAFLQKHKLMELTDDKLILTSRGAGYINGVIPLFYSDRAKEELVRLYERRKLPESEGEEKFLASYSIEKYDRPSVAADVVAMTIRTFDAGNYRSPEKRSLSILLIRRGEHPCMNRWALPGGFLRKGEAVEHCAQRELFEETGLNANALCPLGCFSKPGRDPRGWIISNAFLSVIGKEDLTLMSGDDAMDARWFDLRFKDDGNRLSLIFTNDQIELRAELAMKPDASGRFSFDIISSDLAFDHAEIIAAALKEIQTPYGLHSLAFAFLPAEFTVNELQNVHELLTGKELLAANFRRKMMPYLTATDRMTQGEGHRPAQIYIRNTDVESW